MKTSRGFTLIELMIVVAIIGLLAAVAIPKFADLVRKSKEAAIKGEVGAVRSAVSIYYADNEGSYPTDNLACLTTASRYLQAIPQVAIPTYHDPSALVDNNDVFGMAGLLMMDNGRFKYWNWTATMPGSTVGQGYFWMGCTHLDAKGQIWSVF